MMNKKPYVCWKSFETALWFCFIAKAVSYSLIKKDGFIKFSLRKLCVQNAEQLRFRRNRVICQMQI